MKEVAITFVVFIALGAVAFGSFISGVYIGTMNTSCKCESCEKNVQPLFPRPNTGKVGKLE